MFFCFFLTTVVWIFFFPGVYLKIKFLFLYYKLHTHRFDSRMHVIRVDHYVPIMQRNTCRLKVIYLHAGVINNEKVMSAVT